MDAFGIHHEWVPPGIDAERPSVARVYDVLLGGDNNFAVDREAAAHIEGALPLVRDMVWGQRAFLRRTVEFMAGEAGITQFLDLGAGLPSLENTHEVAQEINPQARTVYFDVDPLVELQSRQILHDNPLTGAATGDLMDIDAVLMHRATTRLLDLSKPVGLLMVGVLHLFSDAQDPFGMVRSYMDVLAPGSHLVATSLIAAELPEAAKLAQVFATVMRNPAGLRTPAAFSRFFDGLDLLEPGVTALPLWRPGAPRAEELRPVQHLLVGGVARKTV